MVSEFKKAIACLFAIITATTQMQARTDNCFATISTGSTGIGLGIEKGVNDWLDIRCGFDFMPHFTKTISFTMTTAANQEDEKLQEESFKNITGKLEEITGITFDRYVDMKAEPSFHNFNLIADFHPFNGNRNWKISAGVYWSFSKTIGRTINASYDSPALVSVNMYNSLYERALRSYLEDEPLVTIENIDVYLTEQVYLKFDDLGKMGMFIGDSIDGGNPYIMIPDENCTISARMTTNKIKPYIGVGYEGPLIKGNGMYNLSVDLGVLFWGGTPNVITHEGVDIAHDLTNLNGQVKSYIDMSNRLPVFPVIKVGISRLLF